MKYISLLLIAILLFSGCQADQAAPDNDKLTVMASLYPQYDFARQVGGDVVDVTLLLPPGVEVHSYEPTPKEIVSIEASDLFLYTGEHMEPWAHRLIDGTGDVTALDLSQSVQMIEGEAHDHEHEHDEDADDDHEHDEDADHEHEHDDDADHEHEHDDDADHEHEHDDDADHEHEHDEDADDHHDHDHDGIDPHIWTDPKNAILMVEAIRDALIEIAPEHEATFVDNASSYIAQLEQLDHDFENLFDEQEEVDIFFAGHNAFGYFAHRYGLHFHSPYSGYSPDAEPSPRSITELMEKMAEADSKVIYYEELIEPKVAEVIRDATGAEMMLLNGAHNVSKEDLAAGISYVDIFRENLDALRKGLE